MTRSDRCSLCILVAGAMLASCAAQSPSAAPPISAGHDALPSHYTFKYTGSSQDFKVPTNVEKITVVARGAAGGGIGGHGGRVYAEIPVTPGETLVVYVGGEAVGIAGGFNGGANGGKGYYEDNWPGNGGGGASDVREGGSGLNDQVLIAGGGGGQAGGPHSYKGWAGYGGKGGGSTGGSGANGGGGYSSYKTGGGGGGGSQRDGGSGGSGSLCYDYYGNGGTSGTLLTGGVGGQGGTSGGTGPGGGGGAGSTFQSYCFTGGGGGGGGSSYIEPSAKRFDGWQGWKNATGNGLVVFSWQ